MPYGVASATHLMDLQLYTPIEIGAYQIPSHGRLVVNSLKNSGNQTLTQRIVERCLDYCVVKSINR